jgi:undecaprenyl diphosphate synthase
VDEVHGLMRLLLQRIDKEASELHRNNVQIRHVGELEGIQPRLAERVRAAVELTRANTGLVLNVAFNYGARQEIARAVRRLLALGVAAEDVTEDVIDQHLDTAGLPDLDLVIRTGGEMRLSNFLLWQAAYAEYYSTPICWPDFGREELYQAFAEFGRRTRRFGGLS